MCAESFALLAAKKANISGEKLVQIKESVASRNQTSIGNREFFAKSEVRMAGCSGCAGGNCAACTGKTCEAKANEENVLLPRQEILFLGQKMGRESDEEFRRRAHNAGWQEKIIELAEKGGEAVVTGERPVLHEPARAADVGMGCTTESAFEIHPFGVWLRQIYGLETEKEFGLALWMPFAKSYYWAEEQRKKERAKLKELGNRASAEEKRRLEALEEEIRRKKSALDALMMKNLENALSILECCSARKNLISPRAS